MCSNKTYSLHYDTFIFIFLSILTLKQELFPQQYPVSHSPQNSTTTTDTTPLPRVPLPTAPLPRVSLRDELFPPTPAPQHKTPPSKPTRKPAPTKRKRSRPPTPVMNAVFNEETGKYMEYKELLKGPDRLYWSNGGSKEFARLLNGRKKDNMKGTNSMRFIPLSHLPPNKVPTYLRICANYRPQNDTQWVVISFIITVKPTPPMLISLQQKPHSTALCLHLMHDLW